MWLDKLNLPKGIVKGLIILFLLLLIVFVVWILFPYGITWSFQSLADGRLMENLPTPPSLVPESDILDISGYSPIALRSYIALEGHTELVEFFSSRVPNAGWQITEVDGNSERSNCYSNCWLRTYLYFSHDEGYRLVIRLMTKTNEVGTQSGDQTAVSITISENQ